MKDLVLFVLCALTNWSPLESKVSKKGSKDSSKDSTDICRGWSCKLSKSVWKQFGERAGHKLQYCDIPVLDANNLSADIFDNISLRETPFILRNGSMLHGEAFGKDYLLKAARKKKLSVKIGQSWNIVRNNGKAPEPVPFNEYVDEIMHRDLWDETDEQLERPYVFDSFSEILGIKGTKFDVPEIVKSWTEKGRSTLRFESGSSNPILLIGGSWSGVSFHRHAAAIQMMAVGYKRWFFYAPSASVPGGDHGAWPIYDWYHSVYPNLKGRSKPLECIQKPGDAIWLPELWYHATLNLGDSVAISTQHLSGESEAYRLQQMWARASHGQGTRFLEDLLKLEPGNLGAISDLALEIQDENPGRALKLLQGLLKKDSWAVDPVVLVVRLLEQKISDGDAKAKKELRQVLEHARPALEKNPRTFSAVRLLEKYYKMIGDRRAASWYTERMKFLADGGVEEWDFHGALPLSQDQLEGEL